jgi:predicted nucleotidyltransferase
MHLDSEDIVRRVLSSADCPIDFIVLFGSRARGESGPRSDHDVAVSVPSLSRLERSQLRVVLTGEFTGPEHAFDFVTIEDVNWSLAHRIARDGLVLYEREDGLWSRFVERVLVYYPDWSVFEDRFLSEFLGGE